LWRGDGRPLTPFELTVYARAGLSAVEALEWADAGIKPYQAEGFRAAGADLATALRFRASGLDGRYLRYANERGESLKDAAAAKATGLDFQLIDQARALGLGYEQLAALRSPENVREVLRLIESGVAVEDVLAWQQEGLDLEACRREIADGTLQDQVEVAVRWRVAFSVPAVRAAWRATGLGSAAAGQAAGLGYRPVDVLEGRQAEQASPRTPNQVVRLTDLGPDPRTVDGTRLPSEVLTALANGRSATTLRAFGYTAVPKKSARSRFVGEHPTGIVVAFHARHARGIAAIEATADGARLYTLMPRQQVPVVKHYSNTDAAVDAFAKCAKSDSLIVDSISSTAFDATELLRTAQPCAPYLAGTATINKLVVGGVEYGNQFWVVPARPARWPRYRISDHAEVESVGELFLTNIMGRVPVGWFDDHAAGLEAGTAGLAVAATRAAAAGTGPMLVVQRTDSEQGIRTTELLRDDGGLSVRTTELFRDYDALVIIDRGRRRRLDVGDPLAAVGRTGALRDVRANEATALFTSAGGPSTQQLVKLLRLRQPELLATEEPVQVLDESGTEVWDDIPVAEGLSKRVVLIDDDRWVAIPPSFGIPARLLPRSSENWVIRPAFREQWGFFSCTEEGSRTSGSSTSELGLLDDDLVGEFTWPDSDQPCLKVKRHRRRKEDEVVAWIASVSAEFAGLDIAMFAAETRLGDLSGDNSPASLFDDDASETLVCNLRLGVDSEALVTALRRAGRREVIDAIRRPKSPAAARRRQRLINLDEE
jgi:hypothetical protein